MPELDPVGAVPLSTREREEMAQLTNQLETILKKVSQIVLPKVGLGDKEAIEFRVALPSAHAPFVIRSSVVHENGGGGNGGGAGCYLDPPGVCYPCNRSPWGYWLKSDRKR